MMRDGIPIEQPQDELTRAQRRANRRRSTRKRPSLVVKTSLEKGFRSILSKMKHHQVPVEHLKDDPLEDDLKSLKSEKSTLSFSDLRPPTAEDPTESETQGEDQDDLTTAVLAKAAHPPRRRRRTILRRPSGKGNLLSMLQDGLNVPASDHQMDLDMDLDMKDYRPNQDEDSDSSDEDDDDDVIFDEYQDEALRELLRSTQAQLNTLLKAPAAESQRLSHSTHKQVGPEEPARPRRRHSLSMKRSNGGSTALPTASLRSRPRRSSSTVADSKHLDSSISGSGAVKRLDSSSGSGSGTSTRRRTGGSKSSHHEQSSETGLDSSSGSGTRSPRSSGSSSKRKEGDDEVVENKRAERKDKMERSVSFRADGKGLDGTVSNRRSSHHPSSRRRGSSVKPNKDQSDRSSRRRSSSVAPTAPSTSTSTASKRLGRRISTTESRSRRRSSSCSRRRRTGRDVEAPTNHDSMKPTSSSSSSESQQRNLNRSRRSARRESVKEDATKTTARSSHPTRSTHKGHEQGMVEPLQLVVQPGSDNSKDVMICSCERASFPATA